MKDNEVQHYHNNYHFHVTSDQIFNLEIRLQRRLVGLARYI